MKAWSAPAREELERLLDEHHRLLVGTGADADEVIADLRRHLEIELDRAGEDGAGLEVSHVRAAFRRLIGDQTAGSGAAARGPGGEPVRIPAEVPRANPEADSSTGLRRGALHWLFLVALPLATLFFELATGMCATDLFDPIAGPAQVAAVAFVPLVFASILVLVRKPVALRHFTFLRVGAALACGICGYYAIEFGPLTPFAFVGVIFFGLGLLPLSPLAAFLVSLDLLRQLNRLQRTKVGGKVPAVWPVAVLGLGLVMLSNLSPLAASLGMRWYSSPHEEVRSRGLALLRSWMVDQDDVDLPWRIVGPGRGTDAILRMVSGEAGGLWGESLEHARFAVTGEDENSEAWQRGRGSTRTARSGMFRELTLDGSRLDGTIDPELLHGYVEWTMILRNGESWPLEGRAMLQLPPGGVVSRVTLWIDGEEREAAFAGRSAATKAYEAVAVVQRRDPILVTTAGPDRVRLRCFPVPANGQMKFRLGVTFPLTPAIDGTSAEVVLPSVVESNFAVPGDFDHHVWITRVAGGRECVDDSDTNLLRGEVRQQLLGRTSVSVRRDPTIVKAWGRAIDGAEVIAQEMRPLSHERRRMVLVLDGNPRVVREHLQVLLQGLASDAAHGLDLWIALDRPVHRNFSTPAEARDFLNRTISSGLADDGAGNEVPIPRRGGFDNGRVLAAAIAELGRDRGLILWLHGPQSIPAGGSEAVRQALERTHGRIELVHMDVIGGKNDVLDALDGRPEVRTVGGVSARAIAREMDYAAGGLVFSVMRGAMPAGDLPELALGDGSRHLARLWAAGEVPRLAEAGPGRRADAVALAVRHQLVTSVSGAVVLETEAQYDEHGLQPADPTSVPRVPEQGSMLVIVLALAALVAARFFASRKGWVS